MTSLQNGLLTWYEENRRPLPWRTSPGTLPDPYHVLVSEVMLQQTQVATVIPYYTRFLERFPTIAALACAPQQEVLRLWQGLGYYSRARNLQATAQIIVQRYRGRIPKSVEELIELPGIGRYTAGAIASLAYDVRAPIVDGNVARVICRLDGIEDDPRLPKVRRLLWARAEALLPRSRPGDFNSALMELGATVCTPRGQSCGLCPLRAHCRACKAGLQERIPVSSPPKSRPIERRCTFCIHFDGRWLIERRPASGRWAGMWQFPTIVDAGKTPTARDVKQATGVGVGRLRPLMNIRHELTHRRYEFAVYACMANSADAGEGGVWVSLGELEGYPLPRPHLKIVRMLAEGLSASKVAGG